MEIQIVEVSGKDVKELQEISCLTFMQTFASKNTADNVQFFLAHNYAAEKLSSELMNPESRFFFAKEGAATVGYLKLNSGNAQTVLPNSEGFEIERIYIDQDSKGKGIGKMFIDFSIREAMKFNAGYIWLGVWEHNEPAIGFYIKSGFTVFGSHIFKLGDDEQTDLLMRRSLSNK
jgi:ribosomal protein S18 acetylase RimI-like enzyme